MPRQLVTWTVLIVIALGTLTAISSSPVRADDAEAALARAMAARDGAEKLSSPGLAPERLAARHDWIVRQFPGTLGAAKIELERVRNLSRAKQWQEAVTAADVFLHKYPQFTVLGSDAAYVLAGIVNDKAAPAEVKRAAFDTLLPHVCHSAWILQLTRNYLAGLNMPAEEKYRLARRAEETCGCYAYTRQYLWAVLDPYTRTLPPEQAVRECQRLIDRYGAESTESVAARQRMLELRARSDVNVDAEFNRFKQAEKDLAGRVKSLRAACDAAIAAAAWNDVVQRVTELSQLPAHAIDGPWWPNMLKQVAAKAPMDVQVKLFCTATACVPMGQAAEDSYVLMTAPALISCPEVSAAAFDWLKRNAHDRLRDQHRTTWLVRQVEALDADPRLRAALLRMAVEVAHKLDMCDLEAEILCNLGERTWDFDLPAAREAFRKAAVRCPGSLASAKARWLLEFFEGKRTVEQGTLPRDPGSLTDGDLTASVSLPAASAVVPDVIREGDAWQMCKLDPKANLVKRQPAAVSSGPTTAALATDGDPKTAWQPERLPAAAIVPLVSPSTVGRIVINTVEQAQIVVSLLDSSGAVLARYERSWNFWEQFRTANFWAPESLALDVLPVPGVSFIRVDLLDALGTSGGIREIEVYGPAYPTRASHLLPAEPIPGGAAALEVQWESQQPRLEVLHQANLESVREFPVMRWNTPWRKPRGPIMLGSPARSLGVEFFGTAATLVVERQGAFFWKLDSGKQGTVSNPEKDRAEHPLADNLPPGRHLLTLESRSLPTKIDAWTPDALAFFGLKVTGQSRVTPAIRFGTPAGAWSPWTTLIRPEGTAVPIADVSGTRPSTYQIGLFFDAREVMGEETASLRGLRVSAAAAPQQPAAASPAGNRSFLADNLAEVAHLAAERKVVVVYPKTGTKREYAAAERIARQAGLYLVSDDIGLNLYQGLTLSVGRPLVHRYSRQLLAMAMAWNDPEYLRKAEGLVTIQRDADGKPAFLFVTGETTIESVEKAADRLLHEIPAFAPPAQPFRLFQADTLEMIYPWQLHVDRQPPQELALRLGHSDRRSVQLGIGANHHLDQLEITCSKLRSGDGHELPAALVRPVGGYEWVMFFGDLRLPNLLLDRPVLPMAANTSTGVWLTVVTSPDTPPGQYSGTLTVASGVQRQSVPVRVTVEPLALPYFPRIATYSFAIVPYWFHLGSAPHEKALRAFARNEALHGVSIVQPQFVISTRPASQGPYPLLINFSQLNRQMEIFEEEYRQLGRPLPQFLTHSPSLHDIDKAVYGEGGHFPPSAAKLFAEQFAEELKRSGRADRFYLKVSDEPSDIAKWTDWARPFRAAGLRTMTAHAAHYPNIDKAVGVMNPWCPNYQHDIWRPFFRERQKAGEAFWWYCCGVPVTRLTGQPVDNLPFYWLTEKWHLDGALNYAAMGASSYCMPVPFRYEHGMDHRIVFLADGTVLDTTRRELEADGIGDCKLIERIRDGVAQLRKQGREADAQRIETTLATTIDGVVPYRYGYAIAPEAWHRARGVLYDLAVQVSGRPEK